MAEGADVDVCYGEAVVVLGVQRFHLSDVALGQVIVVEADQTGQIVHNQQTVLSPYYHVNTVTGKLHASDRLEVLSLDGEQLSRRQVPHIQLKSYPCREVTPLGAHTHHCHTLREYRTQLLDRLLTVKQPHVCHRFVAIRTHNVIVAHEIYSLGGHDSAVFVAVEDVT